ncbi:MAG: DNA topoisomerase IV subunit A, partial [Sphingomonadales bacterium]
YTLAADKLPGGRGFGEPVRLLIDLESDRHIITLRRAAASPRLLVAASDGRGFVVKAEDVMAETRKGKQVVNPRAGALLKIVHAIGDADDAVAAIGDNRKMVVFPLSEVAELARGQGVQLQRYRDGGLSDVITFKMADGLSWAMGGETGRTRTEADLSPWRAARGAAGRMPPTGFPRDNRF